MIIFLLDDEPLQLRLLRDAVVEAEPTAEIQWYSCAEDVMKALEAGAPFPDVSFLDIEMPGIGGIELAKRLKDLNPNTEIVFSTGYSKYALEAFGIHARGYLMKPVSAAMVRRELDNLGTALLPPHTNKRAKAQTFGNFEFFIDGEAVKFKLARTKELLAYLVDRQGAAGNTAELCAVLFEDESGTISNRSHFRTLISDLSTTLRSYGMEELLIKRRNSFAIEPRLLDCDMYRFYRGDISAIKAYGGEYMLQYAWAEMRNGKMESINRERAVLPEK